jgi:putative PIN family toxin of toxin-antitoxin system
MDRRSKTTGRPCWITALGGSQGRPAGPRPGSIVRIVLDTNVFVSGVFFSGPPSTILKAWRDRRLSIVFSPDILDEYARVLDELSEDYPGIPTEPFLSFLVTYGELCVPRDAFHGACRDPEDDKCIACAAHADAACIVSGDRDLLESRVAGVTVLRPREFCARYLV